MKTVAVTVNIPVKDLAKALSVELGLDTLDRCDRRPAPVPVRVTAPSFTARIPTVERAIEDVILATNRLEQDQYTQGEYRAVASLFAAVKKLRRAVHQSNQPQHLKAKSHDRNSNL